MSRYKSYPMYSQSLEDYYGLQYSNITKKVPSNIPVNVPSNVPTNMPSNMPSTVPGRMPVQQPKEMPYEVPETMPYVPSNRTQAPIYVPEGINKPEEEKPEDIEKDMEYMRSMYPEFCKKACAFVDEACDKIDYEGSCMYDEYPDREEIESITEDICNKLQNDETLHLKELSDDSVEGTQYFNPWQRDIVKVILLDEIFRRRHNRYPRRFRSPYPYRNRYIYRPPYNEYFPTPYPYNIYF